MKVKIVNNGKKEMVESIFLTEAEKIAFAEKVNAEAKNFTVKFLTENVGKGKDVYLIDIYAVREKGARGKAKKLGQQSLSQFFVEQVEDADLKDLNKSIKSYCKV